MTFRIPTYQDYLTATPNDHITVEECGELLDEIIAAMDLTDDFYQETWETFVHTATSYTRIRADFALMTIVESSEEGTKRTAAHNSVISALAAVAKLQAQDGRDYSWATKLNIDLTNPDVAKAKLNRRRILDFANYITYVTALDSRLV